MCIRDRSLYLSQPTISARIKALENELDTILFDRSRPRDLSLTEQGLLFWDYAQQIINTYNHSLEKLKSKKKSAEEFPVSYTHLIWSGSVYNRPHLLP